jgi:hypothetical protein
LYLELLTLLFFRRQQQPSPECIAAGTEFVNALQATGQTLPQIQDATVKMAATAGFQKAEAGIKQLSQALQTGQPIPTQAATEVKDGVTAMGTAINSGDR